MSENCPPVTRLAVHLPREQQIVFNAEADVQRIIDRGPPATTLTAFFELCATDPAAREPPLLYSDVVERYVWKQSASSQVSPVWHAWSRPTVIAPLYAGTAETGAPGWQLRTQIRSTLHTTISRMYYTSPADGEKHFLRLLLLAVPSPTSYEDLRTVGGCTSLISRARSKV
jgi:hypothetical protein